MSRTPIALFVLAALAAPLAAHAETAALLPPSGVNVHEGYLSAAGSLARDYLEENGYQVVVVARPPDAPVASIEMSGGEAVAQAAGAGARYAVVVHVTRLSNSAKVKLTVYDATSNVVFYRGTLTAGSPDDLDAVMQRLVKGLVTGQPPAETGEIDTVTEKESDPLNKVTATSVRGLRLGAVVPFNKPEGSEDGLPGLGVFWLYDVRSFLADISLDFHSKENAGDFTVSLGAYYPFSRTNTTAYAGGGLRYGFSDYGGSASDGGSGMSVYAAGGVLFGRMSTVQLRGELGFFQNFFRETTFTDGPNEHSRSNGVIVSAGIGI
jgi:hypothetical protein